MESVYKSLLRAPESRASDLDCWCKLGWMWGWRWELPKGSHQGMSESAWERGLLRVSVSGLSH